MADLNETSMAQLASEMAMNIRNYKAIFKDFGITEEDYYEISKHPFFIRAKEQFALEWNSTMSAADRVRLISASYAEQALPVMGRRMMDPTEPLDRALNTFKQMCANAGIGNDKAAPQNAADRFVITINLGADTEHYNKSIEVNPNDVNLAQITVDK
jgi:hypothetical protein